MLLTVAALVIAAGAIGWWLGARSADESVQLGESAAAVDVNETIQRWAEAWSARDADAFADLYAPTGIFNGVLGVRFEGREAIRQNISDYWPASTGVDLTYVSANDSQGVAVFSVQGIHEEEVFTVFEWDWDDPTLLRSTEMNW